MSGTRLERGAEGIVALTLDNPPVNALGGDVRRGILAATETLRDDPSMLGMIIRGAGERFSAGADVREFGKPLADDDIPLPQVVNALEASTKPVAACLHGAVLGGALELALGCHYRACSQRTMLGFPERNLGIFPGAGGTQRAPRLIGADDALELILNAAPINAEHALKMGLVDALSDDDAAESAFKLAETWIRQAIRGETKTRRVGELPRPDAPSQAAKERHTEALKTPSGDAAIKALEAAATSTSLAEGLAIERTLFTSCLNTDERRGAVHIFRAERAAPKVREAASDAPIELKTIGIVGGGDLGASIAAMTARRGIRSILVEYDRGQIEYLTAEIHRRIVDLLPNQPGVGRNADAMHGLCRITAEHAEIADCDLSVEAVFENLDAKLEAIRVMDQIAKPEAILATSTSHLDVEAIAAGTSRPENVVGLHFFSPAHSCRAMEAVIGAATSSQASASAFALAKRLRKVAVRSAPTTGFIGNRLFYSHHVSAECIMEDGANPDVIDLALEKFGFAMGPFRAVDAIGLEIGWANRRREAQSRGAERRRRRLVEIADILCERRSFGRKSRRGYYVYEENGESRLNPQVRGILAEERERKKIVPREFSDEEIAARYVGSMINEGAKILADGTARRPLEIDVIAVLALGFPRFRGGPMKHADMIGLSKVRDSLLRFRDEDGGETFWTPCPLLEELIASGRTFDDLNASDD